MKNKDEARAIGSIGPGDVKKLADAGLTVVDTKVYRELIMARSDLDRRVGELKGERGELERQLGAANLERIAAQADCRIATRRLEAAELECAAAYAAHRLAERRVVELLGHYGALHSAARAVLAWAAPAQTDEHTIVRTNALRELARCVSSTTTAHGLTQSEETQP